MTTFSIDTFDVAKYDEILSKGLSKGLRDTDGRICIEAAICQVLGLPHGDNPKCVAKSVRYFKIALNDLKWSSPEARAKGLHDLGLAQLGSLGVIDDIKFNRCLAEKIIRVLIPALFREIFPDNTDCLLAASLCEQQGTPAAAYAANAAYAAANAAYAAADADAAYAAADAAANAAYAAAAADAAYAAYAAANAANAAASLDKDKYLILVANLALEVLQELNSPGCALLNKGI